MKQLFSRVVRILLIVYVFFFAYEWWKPLPEAFTKQSTTFTVPDKSVHFLYDLPSKDKKGKFIQIRDVEDRIAALTDTADRLVILTNENIPLDASTSVLALLSGKHQKDKHSTIALITDPKSTRYGGVLSPTLESLRANGTQVIVSDLAQMPDSNLLYSSLWRPFFSWWGNSPKGGSYGDPIANSGKKVPLRSWLAFLNMKSNESHAFIADGVQANKTGKTNKIIAVVASDDLESGVGSTTRVAVEVDDKVGVDLIGKTLKVAALSASGLPAYSFDNITDDTGPLAVTMLDVAHLSEKVIALVQTLHTGDHLDISTRFLSDRNVVGAIKDAAGRNVNVRIILDQNKTIYGHELYGIPNLPIAKELTGGLVQGINIRWCDAALTPCNVRLLLGKTATSTFLLTGGADLTSRDLGGFNIEDEILVQGPATFGAFDAGENYFNKLWSNDGGTYTIDSALYVDDSVWRSSLYRLMELSGLSYY